MRTAAANDFDEFVVARAPDLHHDAYLLTASQEDAERLVATVLAELERERTDLSRATATARLRMARRAARLDLPSGAGTGGFPARFRSSPGSARVSAPYSRWKSSTTTNRPLRLGRFTCDRTTSRRRMPAYRPS
ncbi:hypothetical protein [Flexivirga caeni]|uniref:Uncharacterized protein n=1 Tax=Flexivirga caeni TaxID=2294115 RepID=A0A3M9MFH8_9MICO|nr:hypothetical protein [Flexivirga caeni]RNI24296.1 hypothetical protein EFY87_04835 [Flexivirga caeni]